VLQIHEHGDPLGDDVMGFFAADVGDEPDATGVAFVCGIIETLLFDPASLEMGGGHPR